MKQKWGRICDEELEVVFPFTIVNRKSPFTPVAEGAGQDEQGKVGRYCATSQIRTLRRSHVSESIRLSLAPAAR